MLVCMELPDTTCMLSATFVTECPTGDSDNFGVIQALFNPREIKDYKLEYEWDGDVITRTTITQNGKCVFDQRGIVEQMGATPNAEKDNE